MKVIVVKDYQAMSDLAAEIIANTIKANPSCTWTCNAGCRNGR